MRSYLSRSLPAIAAAILLAILALAAGPRAAEATNSVTYKAAPYCRPGGNYGASSCCCAPRDKSPLTVTKFVRTLTVTKRKTITAKKNLRLRSFSAPADEAASIEGVTQDDGHALFARHVCPRCPAGVSLGKNNGGGSVAYCCPARKSVTVKITKTKIVTKTVTSAAKATIKGVLYYDNNKNGVYDAGIDSFITNTPIVLLYGAKKQRAVGDVLGSGKTDGKGQFQLSFDKQMPGINLEITKDNERNTPLLQFVTDNTGSANVDVPVLRPNDPFTVTPAVLTPSFAAQVNGTGKAGYRVFLYSDGVFVGETVIPPDGTYTVTSAKPLTSGTHKITATMVDDKAAETAPLDCGSLTVVGTPIIPDPAVLTSDNKAKVTGTATPGAVIKIYDDGVYAGQATCGADGKFTVTSTAALSAKTHAITVSQTPTGEAESAQATAGSLTPFTIQPATLKSDHKGEAKGTGTPGATIKIYDNGVLVGSTTVAAYGTYTVTTTNALAQGTHPLTATQTISGKPESSPALSAGTLTVSGDPLVADPAVLTSDNKAKVTGTATPGAVIKIYDDGVYAGQAVCGGDGKFTVIATAALSAKTHAITVSQTPTGQSESSPVDCGPLTPFTVKPAILLADKKASANGTGTPGATIKLYSDGTLVGTTTVAADGTYTVTSSAALALGTHAMTVTQTVSGGTESAPPLSAGSLTVSAGVSLVPNPATLSPSNQAVVNGTGSPNAPIKIYVDGVAAGTGTIGSDGKFTITSLTPLTTGTHAITVSQTVNSVEEAQVSAGSVTVTAAAVSTTVGAPAATTTRPPGPTTTTAVCTEVSTGNRWPLQVDNTWWNTSDSGHAITHDATGNIYLGGRQGDQFTIKKLNLDGTVAWSYANDVTGVDLGGGVNIIKSIVISKAGHLWAHGHSNNKPLNFGVDSYPGAGTQYGFLLKMDAATGAPLHVYTYSNSTSNYIGHIITTSNMVVTPNDDLVVMGMSSVSSISFGPHNISALPRLPSTGIQDCYIAVFNTSSNSWAWAKMFGGNGEDQCWVQMSVSDDSSKVTTAIAALGNTFYDTDGVSSAIPNNTASSFVTIIFQVSLADGSMIRSVQITPNTVAAQKFIKPHTIAVSGTDVFVAGVFSDNVTLHTDPPVSIAVPGIGQYNGWILKLTESGSSFSYGAQWTKFNDNYQYSLFMSPDGTLIGVGQGAAGTNGIVGKWDAATLNKTAQFTTTSSMKVRAGTQDPSGNVYITFNMVANTAATYPGDLPAYPRISYTAQPTAPRYVIKMTEQLQLPCPAV